MWKTCTYAYIYVIYIYVCVCMYATLVYFMLLHLPAILNGNVTTLYMEYVYILVHACVYTCICCLELCMNIHLVSEVVSGGE